jgi:hypothetical protein
MDVLFGHKQLIEEVGARLNRDLNRSTVYRWRKILGFTHPPYMVDHVESLSFFGRMVGLGVSPDKAKQLTIQYMEQRS